MKRIKQIIPADLLEAEQVNQATPQSGVKVIGSEAEIAIIDAIQKEIVKPYDSDKLETHLKGFNTLFYRDIQEKKEKAEKRLALSIATEKREKQLKFFMYTVVAQLALCAMIAVYVIYSPLVPMTSPNPVSPEAIQSFKPYPLSTLAPAPVTSPANTPAKIHTPAPVTAASNDNFIIPTKPYLFENFVAESINGMARFKWVDSEINLCTYMLEKSENGIDFEIVSIVDGKPGTTPETYITTEQNPADYYRLVKIVHGAGVYISRVVNMTPVESNKNGNRLEDNIPVRENGNS